MERTPEPVGGSDDPANVSQPSWTVSAMVNVDLKVMSAIRHPLAVTRLLESHLLFAHAGRALYPGTIENDLGQLQKCPVEVWFQHAGCHRIFLISLYLNQF